MWISTIFPKTADLTGIESTASTDHFARIATPPAAADWRLIDPPEERELGQGGYLESRKRSGENRRCNADSLESRVDRSAPQGLNASKRVSMGSKREVPVSYSSRMLARSLLAVSGIASLAGAFSLGVVVAQQPSAATKSAQLMKQAIAEFPGREVTMTTHEIPPGGGSAPHRHPTTYNFGYVLEGTYRIKLDDGPERVLTKGDTFYEAPNQLHAVSGNASNTEPAKILVVGIGQIGKPRTVPEPQ